MAPRAAARATEPDDDMVSEYQQAAEEVVGALGTDVDRGLTDAEARTRLGQYGSNQLASEPPVPAWKKFLAQFRDVLVILLMIATAISAALWWYERDAPLPYEALAISVVVLLNAILGYVQEQRAETAVAALQQMAAAHAHVVRDGETKQIPAIDIVPGDVMLIEAGDTVPADGRVVRSAALQTAEAALTGESLPMSKDVTPIAGDVGLGDRTNMVFSGTSVTYGHGCAVVTATGMRTEMGHIAGMLARVPSETTPLQKELDRVGRTLGLVVVAIAVVMIATIVWVEEVRGLSALLDVLILGVALAVAAVPEGLPTIVTVVLSIGVQRMARRHAIVRHLSAVETLGSASVIASDKTGTLTRNEMTVREVVTASGRVLFSGTGYAPVGDVRQDGGQRISGALQIELERTLAVADRANNASLHQHDGQWTVQGDPTEGALIVAARKAGLERDRLTQRFVRIGEVPFSSQRKLMSTIHTDAETAGRVLLFTKGAPDILLARCTQELVGDQWRPLSADRRDQILSVNDDLAGRALRTLAIAYRASVDGTLTAADAGEDAERDLVFAGLVGMIDPPRPEAADAVARAKRAGVRPVMITGDHPRTAAVIAQELGLAEAHAGVPGTEIERMSDAALDQTVMTASVYARVNPEHKLRIVKALQRRGAVVAMTGDGVNDAPALKTADIGVAMGMTGTDVSKQAADMVLADDNFATIVAAIEEGRAIFENIRKFLRYLLSSNIGEVITMFFGVVLAEAIGLVQPGNAVVLPLVATQLLWINLVTDGAPALALGLDPADPALMTRPPRPAGERVITGAMWRGILLVGIVMAAGTLYILDAQLPGGFIAGTGTLRRAQTMAFTTLMLFQMFNLFNARSDIDTAFGAVFVNAWLWGAIALSVMLQMAVLYVPFLQRAFSTEALPTSAWLHCVAVASSVLWVRELEKLLWRRRLSR
ncbi:MAG TPA: cation-translocating P-type ATPase [Vicinamibacterales bacterium]|nr:cation-translocating P-type ATPase [Vicinamibacterales bacterium]